MTDVRKDADVIAVHGALNQLRDVLKHVGLRRPGGKHLSPWSETETETEREREAHLVKVKVP
jgi:hypothetical protein